MQRKGHVPGEGKRTGESERAAAWSRNPLASDELLVKKNMLGLSRHVGGRGTAALAAIDSGICHLYAIAKIYDVDEAYMLRGLHKMIEAGLVDKKEETAGGQVRYPYELTKNGKGIVAILKNQPDPLFARCKAWIGQLRMANNLKDRPDRIFADATEKTD